MTTTPITTATPPSLPVVHLLGLPVHNVDMDTVLTTIDSFIHTRASHHIVTADASMLVMAQEDTALRTIIAGADLVTPDSVGILWAARRCGRPLRERVSGVEIVERLCARSASKGFSLYFLGAGPGIAAKAVARMQAKYPGCRIVGARDGFFQESEVEGIVAEIYNCQPDVLCVALGIPKQEKWIAAHRDRLGVPALIGVGGTFDVLSGNTRRAPRILQMARLEWLWRVLANPRKIDKVLLLPQFVKMVRRAPKH
jgi:N-acetylglucosaminyldiphosphoundecaprenol N-acetyl-beta-D-mannosaminyltransferase